MSPRTMRRLGAPLAALALTALAACGGGDGGSSSETEEVLFVAPDKALTAASASYTSVPIEQGYFEEEGLDVTIQPVADALSAVQAVSTGQAFMTYASLNAAVAAYENDPGLAIIGMTNGNIFQVAVPESSPIEEATDLEGTKIGVNTISGASTLNAEGVLKEAGLDPAKDVEFLPVGLGAQAADALDNGTVDAFSGWDAPITVIGDLLGEEMRVIPSPLNELTATSALVVRAESITNEPEMVEGMARAFFKAMVFSEANPEAALKIHWEVFPQSKPADQSEEEALDRNVAVLATRLEITGGEAPGGEFGKQDYADVQETVDTYVELGMLANGLDVESSGIIDYSLVEKYNDFDVDEIKDDAEAWEAK